MFFSTVVIATLACQVAAMEGLGKPTLAKMSVKDMLLGKRQVDGGYQPDTTFCGVGTTCAEACGAGYEQCASNDEQTHCFNSGSSQTCCPNQSGDSCDAGYYCTADTVGVTWCCPNGTSLDDCAAAFSVTGGLSSQIPAATSGTTTIKSTSTITITSTIAASTSTLAATTSNTTVDECTTYTSEVVHTIIPVSATVGSNTTTAKGTGSLPTSSTPATTTTIPVQAGASSLQVSSLAAVVAIVFVALF